MICLIPQGYIQKSVQRIDGLSDLLQILPYFELCDIFFSSEGL